jgi:hypothetical protein
MKLDTGVIYVVYGEDYFKEAINSALSLKVKNEISVVCFCDKEYTISSDVFDQIIVFPKKMERRNHKIQAILDSPFARTLYIDTDTFVCDDITPAFQILDRFDIAIAHAGVRFGRSPSSSTKQTQEVPQAFVEFNGGVLFYRKNEITRATFQNWMDRYNTTSKKLDQPTLREAMYYSEARIYVLPPEYNLTFAGPVFLEGKARIIHGRYGRENRVMPYSKYQKIGDKLNSKSGRRVFVPGIGLITMKYSMHRLKPARISKGIKRRWANLFS